MGIFPAFPLDGGAWRANGQSRARVAVTPLHGCWMSTPYMTECGRLGASNTLQVWISTRQWPSPVRCQKSLTGERQSTGHSAVQGDWMIAQLPAFLRFQGQGGVGRKLDMSGVGVTVYDVFLCGTLTQCALRRRRPCAVHVVIASLLHPPIIFLSTEAQKEYSHRGKYGVCIRRQ